MSAFPVTEAAAPAAENDSAMLLPNLPTIPPRRRGPTTERGPSRPRGSGTAGSDAADLGPPTRGRSGATQSQLLPLVWPDVDLAHKRLRLYAGNAKNRKELWVPLGDAMVERLRTLQATRRSDLVFSAPGGGRLWHFFGRFFKTVKALGLGGTGLNIHCLRHTFASRFAEATGDLLLLQRVGGWSSLALVRRYSHVRAGRDAEAIRAMLDAHDGAAPSERPGPLTAHGRGTLRPA